MAPLLGPSLGPILGAVVTQYLSWPWIFYIMSIIDGVILLLSLFLLRETYGPIILARRRPQPQIEGRRERKAVAKSTWRPLRMLLTQPLIQILALFTAYLYGTMYLVLSTFPILWVKRYHERVIVGGLNYLALGTGYLIGSQVCAFAMDRIYRTLSSRGSRISKPEYKLPLAIIGACLVPAGLLTYAWTAQNSTFWLAPDFGAAILAMDVIVGMQCVTNYIIDTYSRYAASAIGAVTLLRGIAGFGFPLFGPAMYLELDYGWENSLLAFVATFVGMDAPIGLWFFGERIRGRSTWCGD